MITSGDTDNFFMETDPDVDFVSIPRSAWDLMDSEDKLVFMMRRSH